MDEPTTMTEERRIAHGLPIPGSPVSPIEVRVLAGCARGRSMQEIAADNGIAYATARTHLRRMSFRIGVTGGSAPMVDHAYRTGLFAGLQPEPRSIASLPERQRQALIGMSRGQTNADIGRELFLSEDTVKSHVVRLFGSIDAVTRAHAVALGHQHHLFTIGTPQTAVRARYSARVALRGGHMTHAWDGNRTPCRTISPPLQDILRPATPITCPTCRTRLHLGTLRAAA